MSGRAETLTQALLEKPKHIATKLYWQNGEQIFEFLRVHTCMLMDDEKLNMKLAWLVKVETYLLSFLGCKLLTESRP